MMRLKKKKEPQQTQKQPNNQVKVARVKRQKTFYTILGIISDAIIIPVIIISLFSSFVLFSNQRKNEAHMVFGVSFAAVQSGSMEAAGFKVKDIVIVVKTNTDNLRPKSENYEGDIIAFYNEYDSVDRSVKKTTISDFDNVPEPTLESIANRKEKSEILNKYTRIYFHRIIGVSVDETGTRFFKTKGDSNVSADVNLIREDLVVGRYVNTPVWIREVFKFCASSIGMMILVVVPLTVLIFMQMLSLLEQISALMTERRVIAGNLKYNSKESIKANVGIEMRDFDKIYYYDVSDDDKNEVYKFLWSYPENQKLTKRIIQYAKIVDSSVDTYSQSGADAYWGYWKSYYKKGRTKRKVRLMYLVSQHTKEGMKYDDAYKLSKAEIKDAKLVQRGKKPKHVLALEEKTKQKKIQEEKKLKKKNKSTAKKTTEVKQTTTPTKKSVKKKSNKKVKRNIKNKKRNKTKTKSKKKRK